MHVYIPIGAVITVILAYMLIGVVLFIPLLIWQGRFINGMNWWEGNNFGRGIVISAIAWPFILGFNIKTEIRYRRKGLL